MRKIKKIILYLIDFVAIILSIAFVVIHASIALNIGEILLNTATSFIQVFLTFLMMIVYQLIAYIIVLYLLYILLT